MKPIISASIMCCDENKLEKNIKILNENNVELIHYDIMDGHYVPNIVLNIQFMDQIRELTDIPLDVHIMHTDAHELFEIIKPHLKKGDRVAFHLNNCKHPLRLISQIKELGCKAGVVLPFEVPICFLEDICWDIDYVIVMSIPTGFAGAKFIEQTYTKVPRLIKFFKERGLDIPIMIDGSVTLENVDKVLDCGVRELILGYVGCFNESYGVDKMLKEMRKVMAKYN